jgi:hypothetical protein
VVEQNPEYNRVTPVFVKQASGSSLIYLTTATTVDFSQNPEIIFPYKKAVIVPENNFQMKEIVQ